VFPPIVSKTLNVLGDHPDMAELDTKLEFDRRKSKRAEADEVAFVSVAGSSTRCQIVNISSDGAAIDVPDASYIPNRFRLMTARDRVVRNCRIAWIRENRIGVEFEASFEDAVPMTHRDRQFLQYLRGGDWRRATNLPDSQKLISKLLMNGWIESIGNGHEFAYRITPKGLAAKMAPVKL
jgi:hypothetical protein